MWKNAQMKQACTKLSPNNNDFTNFKWYAKIMIKQQLEKYEKTKNSQNLTICIK
jgi:hypothetical protein